jgi:hypothetical protein
LGCLTVDVGADVAVIKVGVGTTVFAAVGATEVPAGGAVEGLGGAAVVAAGGGGAAEVAAGGGGAAEVLAGAGVVVVPPQPLKIKALIMAILRVRNNNFFIYITFPPF